jgi:peptidoglycan/xylan/chitin deacetylase (PgdA/CDA1 family)
MFHERTAVLMYHRVIPDEPMSFGQPSCYRLRGTAVTPHELQAQLDWLLARRIQVLALADVVQYIAHGKPPPPGVVLTFDDGHAECLTTVAPLLRSRGVPASYFVSTGIHASAARAHAIDEYYFLIDHADAPALSVELPDGQIVRADLRLPAHRLNLVRGPLKQALVQGTSTQQEALFAALRTQLCVSPPAHLPAQLYLARSDWSLLARDGGQVEAHGHSHRRLTELSDAEVDEELASCSSLLGERGVRARFFAYPDGAHDDRVAACVAASGMRCALTVVPGDLTERSDLFLLPRYFVRSGASLEALLHNR